MLSAQMLQVILVIMTHTDHRDMQLVTMLTRMAQGLSNYTAPPEVVVVALIVALVVSLVAALCGGLCLSGVCMPQPWQYEACWGAATCLKLPLLGHTAWCAGFEVCVKAIAVKHVCACFDSIKGI